MKEERKVSKKNIRAWRETHPGKKMYNYHFEEIVKSIQDHQYFLNIMMNDFIYVKYSMDNKKQ